MDTQSEARERRRAGYPQAVALVAAATALAALGRPFLALPDVVMVYLLAIMVVAVRYERGASVLASALSVAAYDLFFIPPYFTFAVHDAHNVLSFVMMFVVGQLLSALALRLRRGEREARAAALHARTEQMRSTLLSAVSHDLRTPLAAITGAATTLREDGPGLSASQREDMVDTICEEAERLERLVSNLLDMTRLESGAMTVKREWVPLEEVVGSALTRLERRLHGRAVTTALPEALPLVSIDPVLLEQVFVNLIENATKYTPPGSPLELRARCTTDGVELLVADRGPGVPPGLEERVFERFYRGIHVGVGGAGLGLPISRGIVEAHGGTLTVRAREGGGAEFRVLLPLPGPMPAPPPEPSLADAEAP